jgi:hypothetical protein
MERSRRKLASRTITGGEAERGGAKEETARASELAMETSPQQSMTKCQPAVTKDNGGAA